MPKRVPVCFHCNTNMKPTYVRVGKSWKRLGWGCPRCGHVDSAFPRDFPEGRKSRMS